MPAAEGPGDALGDALRELRAAARTIAALTPRRHPPEQLWPYFSQVDQFNRAGGSSPVEYEVTPIPGAASIVTGTSRKLGVVMRYRELPYEWVRPRYVQAEMVCDKGPFRYLSIRGEMLVESPEVRYSVSYVPRRRLGLAGPIARAILKKFVAVYRQVDDGLPEALHDPLGAKGFERRGPGEVRRAEELAERWRPIAPDPVVSDALADFVATAPDPLVGRMRPYALAQQFGTSRSETLQFCCRAARGGILESRWDLVCPSCGGAKVRVSDLSELGARAHCEICNIRYDADLERNVELSFRPAPEVRAVPEDEFCLQSPSHQRRIVAQVNVEPGATLRLPLALEPGHYRLRCIGRMGEALFDVAYGRPARVAEVRVGDDVERVELECGSAVEVVLINDGPHWRTARFERHGYREDAATAADVRHRPEFRESFGEEVLSGIDRVRLEERPPPPA